MAMTEFWHPFASMGTVEATGELTIVRGEGAYVFDDGGRRLFDASGALWYANVGHGRSELAEAAAAQIRKIAAFSNYAELVTRCASGRNRVSQTSRCSSRARTRTTARTGSAPG
jgi:adenosylmethionine-8-amino-7-oxononanoate aminotransferase